MKKYVKNNLLQFIIGTSALILAVVVWIVAEKTVKNETLVPSFSATVISAWKILGEAVFWKALGQTLLKVFLAVLISFLLALIVAGLGRIIKVSKAFFKPLISIIRTLPTMAILVLILIYSSRAVAPIIVASLVLFPMIHAQMSTAFESIDDGIISATKIFKLTKSQKLFKVFVPIVAPKILSYTGSNISFGLKLVISAEIMAYTFTSIGGMMQEAAGLEDRVRLMALTLVAVVLGLIIELAFHLIFKFAFKWCRGEGK